MLSLTSKAYLNALIFVPLTWTIISETELISSLGDIFLDLKKIFLLQNMHKMTLAFLHDASILVSVGSFLMHQHSCQVLGKSKSEIARAPLIFAYNLVIKRTEKSGAQVLRVRFFSFLKQT